MTSGPSAGAAAACPRGPLRPRGRALAARLLPRTPAEQGRDARLADLSVQCTHWDRSTTAALYGESDAAICLSWNLQPYFPEHLNPLQRHPLEHDLPAAPKTPLHRHNLLARWTPGVCRLLRALVGSTAPAASRRSILGVEELEARSVPSTTPTYTIPFTLTAPTSLINQGIYVAMYGGLATPLTPPPAATVLYDIQWDTSGNFSEVSAGSFVPVEKLSFTNNQATIQIPDIPNNSAGGLAADTYQISGARIVIGVGNKPILPVVGTLVTPPAPNTPSDPNTALNYDFVEFTLDGDGIHLNTTTIDQFGFPITVTASPSVSPPVTSSGVGVQENRAGVFANYSTFLGQQTAASDAGAFQESLTDGNTGAGSIYLPRLTSISAHSGSGPITLVGTNFNPSNIQSVNFGTTQVLPSAITFNADGSMTVTPPALSNTTVDVTVTTTGGTSPANAFLDYYTFGSGGTATVTGITPAKGPTQGGSEVLITGTNFTPATPLSNSVLFGANAAAFTIISTTQIEALTPAAAAGTVKVAVTINGAQAATTPSYVYVSNLPTVTNVSPSSGPTAAGTTVTVTGTNFVAGKTTVKFGTAAGTKVVVASATSLTVTAPAHAAGTVDVLVTTPAGTSAATAADQFTYGTPAPTGTQLRLLSPDDILAIESVPPVVNSVQLAAGGSLTANQIYYYVVTATSNANNGQGETVPSVPGANAEANGIPGYKSIAVSWMPVINATGYNIYRSTSTAPSSFQFLAHVTGGNTQTYLDNGSQAPTAKTSPINSFTYDPLNSYFDAALSSFFSYYTTHTFSLTVDGIPFTGTTVTPGNGNVYTYLHLTDSSKQTNTVVNVYEPFFSTNTNDASDPPPPSFITGPAEYETPGQMVFGCDGVFNTGGIAADVENPIVSAFNRGIAALFKNGAPVVSPANWATSPADFYSAGATANFYSAYFHQTSVSIANSNGQGLAYGFPYDDQGQFSSYFSTPATAPATPPVAPNTISVSVTLEAWTATPPPKPPPVLRSSFFGIR